MDQTVPFTWQVWTIAGARLEWISSWLWGYPAIGVSGWKTDMDVGGVEREAGHPWLFYLLQLCGCLLCLGTTLAIDLWRNPSGGQQLLIRTSAKFVLAVPYSEYYCFQFWIKDWMERAVSFLNFWTSDGRQWTAGWGWSRQPRYSNICHLNCRMSYSLARAL